MTTGSLLLAGLTAQVGLAQDMFTVSGVLSDGYYQNSAGGPTPNLTNGSFEATIYHNSMTPLSFSRISGDSSYTNWDAQWDDAVTSIQYRIFDRNGDLVLEMTDELDDSGDSYSGVSKTLSDNNSIDRNINNWFLDSGTYTSTGAEYNYIEISTQVHGSISAAEIAGLETYPNPFEHSEWDFTNFYFELSQADYVTGARYDLYVSGAITEISGGVTDTDGDGVSDADDAFPNDPNEATDSDGDGIGDNSDAFPNDANESADSDGDGVGDNGDVFPDDASESADTDGDGVGNNSDAFPIDINESTDSDGDGVGDNGDVFPNDASESADTDGDGVGDNSDANDNSDTSATVTLAGIDSGVSNKNFSNGETLADRVSALSSQCESQAKNHGKYVKCADDGLKGMRDAGDITKEERKALKRIAAQSSIGK